MMLKFIPLTALALGLSSGVALADHHGGGPREWGDHRAGAVEHHGGGVVVRDHRDFHGGGAVVRGGGEFRGGREWHGGGVVVRGGHEWHGGGAVVRGGREWHGGGHVIVRGGGYYGGYGRRPIYVNRPIIRERYYDHYRRPALIVENESPITGYYWVPGSWQWNGSEWIWQPGHYEPDPNYGGYYDGY